MNGGYRVIGIDCGLAITGWAVMEKTSATRNGLKLIDFGVVKTKASDRVGDRLGILFDEIRKIIRRNKPFYAAIESLFYFKNQKTVMGVGQARGVLILAAKKENLEVFDYTPLQVKQAITGYGRATKQQMQTMVKSILGLREIPKPDDAADALAVAICHLNTSKKLKG